MMDMYKVALFGGTLLAAGIANAEIMYDSGFSDLKPYGRANAYNASIGDSDFLADIAPDVTDVNINITTSVDGQSTGVTANHDQIRVHSTTTPGSGMDGYASSRFNGYLKFDKDTDVELSWDMSDSPGSFLEVSRAIGDFIYDLEFNATFGVDNTVLTMLAGVVYYLDILTFTDFYARSTEPRTAFASVRVVPAPGAAALAGIAGLVAVRRRR